MPQADNPTPTADHAPPAADFSARLARARFRAWHRGTREADYTIGGFFDAGHRHWNEAQLCWFEALLQEEDIAILAWAMGREEAPERFAGPMLEALRRLDYVRI